MPEHQQEKPLSRRYVYDRITHEELSRRLTVMGLSARDLARASGALEDRVMKWLSGAENIPPHIDLLTRLWMEIPEVDRKITGWLEFVCHDVRD